MTKYIHIDADGQFSYIEAETDFQAMRLAVASYPGHEPYTQEDFDLYYSIPSELRGYSLAGRFLYGGSWHRLAITFNSTAKIISTIDIGEI